MSNEREFHNYKRDFIQATKELGLQLPQEQAEEKLRNLQARAQEHDVSMSDIEKANLRRVLREPLPDGAQGSADD